MTRSKCMRKTASAPSRFCRRKHVSVHAASALAALNLIGASMGFASAGAQVEGQIDSMQLQATNASIREVLDALPREFRVTYQLPPDVQRQITGRYSGALNQVLARIL